MSDDKKEAGVIYRMPPQQQQSSTTHLHQMLSPMGFQQHGGLERKVEKDNTPKK